MRFSVGAVGSYTPNGCGGPDLPLTVPEGRAFRDWYLFAGHNLVTHWENGDVWGSDFRDSGGDVDPSGGSELPDIYYYTGHGTCQNPPASTRNSRSPTLSVMTSRASRNGRAEPSMARAAS